VCGSQNSGIFRTTNGGDGWTKVSSLLPGWDPLITPNGDIYFTANGNQAILKSADQGLTWTSIAKPGSGNGWYTPIEMPDGSIVAVGQNALVQSRDGKTWNAIGSAFPSGVPSTQGNIAYNPIARAFFIAFWDCGNVVPANAIWKEAYAGTPIIRKPGGSGKPEARAAFDVSGRKRKGGSGALMIHYRSSGR
jgi:hypothetical protein